jgi:hypothetical protein
VPLFYDLTTF